MNLLDIKDLLVLKVVFVYLGKINFTKLNLFRGFYATLPREIIGCSLWFGTYNYLKQKNIHPIISGSLTGAVSWTLSYPIDVIKTRIQSNPKLSYKDAIKMGYLWKGYKYCILRTIVFSSILVPTYELLFNYELFTHE